jgi:hypothetical protein
VSLTNLATRTVLGGVVFEFRIALGIVHLLDRLSVQSAAEHFACLYAGTAFSRTLNENKEKFSKFLLIGRVYLPKHIPL